VSTPRTKEAQDAVDAANAEKAKPATDPIPSGVTESAPQPASRGAPTDDELADVAARTGLNAALDDLVNTVHAVAPQLQELVEAWETYAREDQGSADRVYSLNQLVGRTRAVSERLQKVAAPNVGRA
jgi:hypothetical protein